MYTLNKQNAKKKMQKINYILFSLLLATNLTKVENLRSNHNIRTEEALIILCNSNATTNNNINANSKS